MNGPAPAGAATGRRLRVLQASWVLDPYASAGPGPGMVACRLPQALRRVGIETSVMIPEHRGVTERLKPEPLPEPLPFSFHLAGHHFEGEIRRREGPGGVPIYTVGNPRLFHRDRLYNELDELHRIVLFSLGVLRLLQNSPHDVVVCHDWPTGLIPAHLRIHEKRIFRGGPVPRSIYCVYDPANRGLFPQRDFGLTGLAFEHFPPLGAAEGDRLSLLEIGRQFADKRTAIKPDASDFDHLARQEMGLYRTLIPDLFEGMEEASRIDDQIWLNFSLREKLKEVSSYVLRLVDAQEILSNEQKALIWQAVEHDQEAIFKQINNLEELFALLADLKEIDWEQFETFRRRVKLYDPERGQLEGGEEVRVLEPSEIEMLPLTPDEDLQALAKEKMPHLVRVTLAAGVGLDFLGRSAKAPVAIHPLPGIESSFLAIQARDHSRAQEECGCLIPWYIVIPEGERGEMVRAHFESYGYFGLASEQIRFLEQKGRKPVLDAKGDLAMDFEKKRLLFSPLGHGQLLDILAESDLFNEKLYPPGQHHVFVSSATNLGADIASSYFLKIFGRHLQAESTATVEVVGQRVHEEGGIPVEWDRGRRGLLEGYALPAHHIAKARHQGTPFNTSSYFFDLDFLRTYQQSGVQLRTWLKPERLLGRPIFKEVRVLGDVSYLLPPLFLSVSQPDRYIVPANMAQLEQTVRELLAKHRNLGWALYPDE